MGLYSQRSIFSPIDLFLFKKNAIESKHQTIENLILVKSDTSDVLAEIEKRAEFTRMFSVKMGFQLFAQSPSASLTALSLPAGLDVDSTVLRQELEDQFKITIMGGQDQAKGKILRIGHMGYILPTQMISLMMNLGELVHKHNSSLCSPDEMQKLELEMKKYWGLA